MKSKKTTAKQKKLKNDIISLASELGFDDTKFLKNPVSSDKDIAILLIKKYTPSIAQPIPEEIALCEYYTCSNSAYFATQTFVKVLNEVLRIPAEHNKDIKLKHLAVKSGGRVGLNMLYYHDEFGSYINMQCVLVSGDIPLDDEFNTAYECELCGKCIKACPTKAISFDGWIRKKCLRDMMNEGFPLRARKKVYQLLGCEKCQICCPMNKEERKDPQLFDVNSILKGEQTRHLKELAGKNSATRTKLITQSICYSVAMKDKSSLGAITRLTNDSSEQIKEYAKWGKKELEKL